MKILYPFFGETAGGAIHSVVVLLGTLKRDHPNLEPLIILHQPSKEVELLLERENIAFEKVIMPWKGFSPKNLMLYLYVISKTLLHHRPKLVHGNDIRINILWSVTCFLFSTPYVWHQRSMVGKSFWWNMLFWGKKKNIAVSENIKHSFPENFQSKVEVIPDLVFLQKTSHQKLSSSKSNNAYQIGFFGRVVEQKNLKYLLQIFSELRKQRPAKLWIYGKADRAYLDGLRQYVAQQQLQDDVEFVSYIDNVSDVMIDMDLVITVAINDGWGRTIAEAQALGIKVAASDSGGHRDLIKTPLQGRLLPLTSAVQAAEIISDYLENGSTPKVNFEMQTQIVVQRIYANYLSLMA